MSDNFNKELYEQKTKDIWKMRDHMISARFLGLLKNEQPYASKDLVALLFNQTTVVQMELLKTAEKLCWDFERRALAAEFAATRMRQQYRMIALNEAIDVVREETKWGSDLCRSIENKIRGLVGPNEDEAIVELAAAALAHEIRIGPCWAKSADYGPHAVQA